MADDGKEKDARIQRIATSIRVVPNFPKPGLFNSLLPLLVCLSLDLRFWSPRSYFDDLGLLRLQFYMNHSVGFGWILLGIMFQDITTLLLDPKAFRDTVDLFVERYTGKGISVVAGNFSLPLLMLLFFVIVGAISGDGCLQMSFMGPLLSRIWAHYCKFRSFFLSYPLLWGLVVWFDSVTVSRLAFGSRGMVVGLGWLMMMMMLTMPLWSHQSALIF